MLCPTLSVGFSKTQHSFPFKQKIFLETKQVVWFCFVTERECCFEGRSKQFSFQEGTEVFIGVNKPNGFSPKHLCDRWSSRQNQLVQLSCPERSVFLYVSFIDMMVNLLYHNVHLYVPIRLFCMCILFYLGFVKFVLFFLVTEENFFGDGRKVFW